MLIHVRAVQGLLEFGGHPGANDSDYLFFSFRVDDNHESAIDRADGDEAVLEVGMLCVEDLEIVGARLEEPLSLRERQTVLALVADVFLIVSLEVHIDRQ